MNNATRRRPSVRAIIAWTLAVGIPLAFLAIFFVWPVVGIVSRGVAPDGEVNLRALGDVFTEPRAWRIIRQTLSLAIAGMVGSVVLGVPGAYVLYRTRFPGRGVLRAAVIIPFVLPSVVVGVAFRTLFAPNGLLGFLDLNDSFAAIVCSLVFFNFGVVVRTVGTMWSRLDPRLAEAASVLGASGWRIWWTVTLPALAPAIASAAAITFLFCASAYGVVMVLGGVKFGTVETEIWYRTTQLLDLPAAAALSIVQLVFTATSLAVAGWLGSRAQRPLRLSTGRDRAWSWRHDWPATLVTLATIVGLLGLPLVNLAVASLRVGDGFGLRHYRALTEAGSGVATFSLWQAMGNSLVTAAWATLISIVLGVLVSVVLSRRPRTLSGRRALGTLDFAFMLPLGVSAVTVGFGFLITLNRPPFDLRSSPVLVPIAQALVALPLVVRTLLPVLRAIDPRQREAARTLGAREGRVLTTIDLPYALAGLGVAVGFAFGTSLGEFGATSFLATSDRPTLPILIFRLIGRPGADSFGMAMAASVILAVLTTSVMAIAERLRPREVS